MRIALIADFSASGGTRTFFEMLALFFCGKDIDICALLQFPNDDPALPAFASARNIKWQRLNMRRRIFTRPVFAQIWELWHICLFIGRYRPDMVFVSTADSGYWLSVFLLPVPSLLMMHSNVGTLGRLQRFILAFFLPRTSKRRQLITVSKYAADRIERLWKQKVSYIHNVTPFPDVLEQSRESRKAGNRIITAGHVTSYKNPAVWLNVAQRVLARYPDATFSWYGEGDMLETMRLQSKGIPGIQFRGRAENMQDVYASSDIYFHPSYLENHSISVLEAMSYGLPCVVSDRGGLPESVVHGVTGYIENADDAEAFAERICSLLDDKKLRTQLGLNAKNQIKKYFMPYQWEQKIIAAIQQCLPGSFRSEPPARWF